MEKCPFCNFKERQMLVDEDRYVFAIVSESPINKYHVLVVPRRHYESFVDLPDGLASRVFLMAKRVSIAVRKASHADAITHLSDDAIEWKEFNQVRHYKFHVIPRYKNDKVKIDWHRRKDPGLRVRAGYAREVRNALSAR